MRIKGPCRLVPPFEGEHLEWAWTSRLRSYYTCVATICFSLPITSGDRYQKLKTRISCQELMEFHKWGCRERWLLPCRYIVVNDPCSNAISACVIGCFYSIIVSDSFLSFASHGVCKSKRFRMTTSQDSLKLMASNMSIYVQTTLTDESISL